MWQLEIRGFGTGEIAATSSIRSSIFGKPAANDKQGYREDPNAHPFQYQRAEFQRNELRGLNFQFRIHLPRIHLAIPYEEILCGESMHCSTNQEGADFQGTRGYQLISPALIALACEELSTSLSVLLHSIPTTLVTSFTTRTFALGPTRICRLFLVSYTTQKHPQLCLKNSPTRTFPSTTPRR